MNPLFAMHDSQLSAVAGNLKGIDRPVPVNAAAGARQAALVALKAAGIPVPPDGFFHSVAEVDAVLAEAFHGHPASIEKRRPKV
jgi:hypothetical protein